MKNKKIDGLIKEFIGNEWLFPPTHSDDRIVSKDLSFRTYVNDSRDYMTISIEDKELSIEISIRDDGISVSHPLGMPVTEKKVEAYLTIMKKHFSKSISKLEEKRILDIKEKKKRIKKLREELSILENK